MKDIKDSTFDSSEQLKLLKVNCKKFAPKIYGLYALYLQEIRSILVNSVRSSVINLVMARSKDSLGVLTNESIKEFQDKVDKLTVRCGSNLTLKSLNALAKQIDEENKVLLEKAKVQISDAVTNKKVLNFSQQKDDSDDYNQNINISSELPIQNPPYIKNWFAYQDSKDDIFMDEKPDKYNSEVGYNSSKGLDLTSDSAISDKGFDLTSDSGISDKGFDLTSDSGISDKGSDLTSDSALSDKGSDFTSDSALSDKGSDYVTRSDDDAVNKLDVFKSLFSMASQVFDIQREQNVASNELKEQNKDLDGEENQKEQLPLLDNPEDLSLWINDFENALSRNLRNLSQAINLELLKRGIVNSIVPVSILDAVIMGHMGSEYSDANLLKITVPANSSPFGEALDLICLLIRTTELEFENHRLRKVRTEIQNHQKIISKMIKQYRYWQSRSLADNIHQNWWQSPRTQ